MTQTMHATDDISSVSIERFDTPAGPMAAAWAGEELVYAMLGPETDAALNRWLSRHRLETKVAKARLAPRMQRYFAGRPDAFDGLRVRFPFGTEFQRDVWKGLLEIPFGETWTYGQLAAHVGRPQGARPVGQAVGANPITVVVPCHRVVGSDQSLTGFGCGLPAKRILLKTEGWSLQKDKLQARQPAFL